MEMCPAAGHQLPGAVLLDGGGDGAAGHLPAAGVCNIETIIRVVNWPLPFISPCCAFRSCKHCVCVAQLMLHWRRPADAKVGATQVVVLQCFFRRHSGTISRRLSAQVQIALRKHSCHASIFHYGVKNATLWPQIIHYMTYKWPLMDSSVSRAGAGAEC